MSCPKVKISALVITYNEIDYIKKCIEAVEFADEIIVVDSFSTDGTYEYLKDHSRVKVMQRPFENFTDQKSFTLKQATHDWVLFVDADEVVTVNLRDEILATINGNRTCNAYWFYRTFMFKRKKLSFSGCQTDKNYRLFRKSKVQFSKGKIVHETLDVNGESGILANRLIHYSYKTFADFKGKILRYGRMKAIEAFRKEKRFSYLKLFIKPLWKFFNCYVIRLGILDGHRGLVIAYIHSRGVVEQYTALRSMELESKDIHTIETVFEKA